jgi:adenylate cyclase
MARESGGSFRASDAPERFRATGKGGRFEAIKELSRVVTSSSGTIGELLRVLRWQSQQLVDSDRCSLFVLNQQGTHVWTILDDGKVIQIPSHSGLVGRCITDCRVVNIADAYSEDGFNRNVDQETGYRTKSVLVVPVRQDGGQMLGALQVINKLSADTFTAEDADVLEAFASVSAMAIVNMQKSERERKSTRKFEALAKVGQLLMTTFEARLLFLTVRQEARALLDAERSSIFLVDATHHELHTVVGDSDPNEEGEDGNTETEMRLALDDTSIAGKCARSGEAINIANAYEHPSFNPEVDRQLNRHTTSMLTLPVR